MARLSALRRLRNCALTSLVRHSRPGAERVESVRRLLRRYPDWARGHRILAEESLAREDVARAYASALCYKQLAKNSSESQSEALLLIGKCFLKRGDWRSALLNLTEAQRLAPSSDTISEDIAAAHMLGGDLVAAHAALESIPEKNRSPQAKAAIAFVRSKIPR